jgi:hypothetical protein
VEAISRAKELNDMHALAVALFWATVLGHYEGTPNEAERCASDLIELSTRQNFPFGWLAGRFSIGAPTVLIAALLTPVLISTSNPQLSFFKSEACRNELERFS